jgi:hypothetical protein
MDPHRKTPRRLIDQMGLGFPAGGSRRAPPCAMPRGGRTPKNLSARERMERKLRTKRGRAIYHRQRGASVEPAFGQMKDRQGAHRFSMRGLGLCRGEGTLDVAVHNLRKRHRESVRRQKNANQNGKQGAKRAWIN